MEDNKTPQENTPLKPSEILHEDGKLSSLRTYQGDMAEFIKEKNESVTSIALKEKAHREEKQKQEPKAPTKSHVGTVLSIFVSLILLLGGGTVAYYAAQKFTMPEEARVNLPKKVIPYTTSIEAGNIDKESLRTTLSGSVFSEGVTLLNITDPFSFEQISSKLQINLPSDLSRNLKADFAIGVYKKGDTLSPVMVLTTVEYGGAFSGMLDWERNLKDDLSFIASPTEATSTTVWRDMIVKNKDTRVLVDQNNKSVIAYTFLDKNTILITRDYHVIPDINDLYIGGSLAR